MSWTSISTCPFNDGAAIPKRSVVETEAMYPSGVRRCTLMKRAALFGGKSFEFTATVSCVELTNVVTRTTPSIKAMQSGVKFVPIRLTEANTVPSLTTEGFDDVRETGVAVDAAGIKCTSTPVALGAWPAN